MKLTLRRDTAQHIVARLLLEASRLELNHRTPVTGETFTVRPVTTEREIARLRRWARQLRKAIACGSIQSDEIRALRRTAAMNGFIRSPSGSTCKSMGYRLTHRTVKGAERLAARRCAADHRPFAVRAGSTAPAQQRTH